MAACPGCGIDEEGMAVPDALGAIRGFPRRYRETLDSFPPARLRERPDPDTWSALEYAVHFREVLELLAMSLPMVVNEPDVQFPPIDVDEAFRNRPDWVMDPALAVRGISAAADAIAQQAGAMPWSAWDRAFRIGDNEHAASWIVQHAAHEGAHHLRDIAQVAQRLGVRLSE
jgi:hypothetical protein